VKACPSSFSCGLLLLLLLLLLLSVGDPCKPRPPHAPQLLLSSPVHTAYTSMHNRCMYIARDRVGQRAEERRKHFNGWFACVRCLQLCCLPPTNYWAHKPEIKMYTQTLLQDTHLVHNLNPAGVEHDAHGGAQAAGGQVLPELGADGSAVAVLAGDLAPDAAEVGALLQGLGLVDEGQLLALVELGLLGALHALDADDGGVVGLDLAVADVAQDLALDEESNPLAAHGAKLN